MKLWGMVLLVAAGCSGSSKPHVMPSAASTPDAIKQWERGVMTAYEQANAAAFDGKIDPNGYFIATDPNEVWDGPQFLDAHHKMLGGTKPGTFKLASKDLHVVASSDGKSALMADSITWDFGNGQPVPLRWTAVFVNQGGSWVMSASHVSFGVPNEMAFKLVAEGKMPVPHDIPDKVDAGAKDLLEVFDADLASPERLSKDISDRPDVYVFGTDPNEIWQGGDALRKAFVAQISQFHMKLARRGGARASVAGEFGWVMANVEIKVTPEGGNELVVPLRSLAVYQHEAAGWKLLQGHFSNAVPN